VWYKLFICIVINIYNLRRAIIVLKASKLRISVSWNVALFSDVSKVVLLSFSWVEWIKKEFVPCIGLAAVRNKRSITRDVHEKIKGAISVLTLHKKVCFCCNRGSAVRHSSVNLFRRLVFFSLSFTMAPSLIETNKPFYSDLIFIKGIVTSGIAQRFNLFILACLRIVFRHTTNIDSKPQSQQSSGRRPTP
jgi:hypothetical protein